MVALHAAAIDMSLYKPSSDVDAEFHTFLKECVRPPVSFTLKTNPLGEEEKRGRGGSLMHTSKLVLLNSH